MTTRRRSPSSHPMLSTPSTSPIGASWVDDAYCFLGSESVVVCRFGIYGLSVVLRECVPTPRPAILQPVRLSKPDIPRRLCIKSYSHLIHCHDTIFLDK